MGRVELGLRIAGVQRRIVGEDDGREVLHVELVAGPMVVVLGAMTQRPETGRRSSASFTPDTG